MAGRDLLERLRPTGAPGGAGPVAVPADDAVRDRELEPVFQALEETVAECDQLGRHADLAAAEQLARADRDVQQWLAEARLAAAEQRAAAAAAVSRAADAAAVALLADAEADAVRLRISGRAALGPLVERIVALVRDDLLARPPPRRSIAVRRSTAERWRGKPS